MKNLHIILSNNPSRLVKIYNDVNRENFILKLDVEVNDSFKEYVNVYITSEEDIADNDWIVTKDGRVVQVTYLLSKDLENAFKIILTTDQDLINDGVQAIDDEFLKWFVKNPNCDFVRTLKVPYFDESSHSYVLIITKEEDICPECGSKGMTLTPKTQCYCGYSPKEEEFELVSIGEETIKLAIPMMQDKEEIKQETIEEAAERLYPTTINSFTDSGFDMSETERLIFINGAKWQQEQNKNLYTEEEVKDMLINISNYINTKELKDNSNTNFDEWVRKRNWFITYLIQQFKK